MPAGKDDPGLIYLIQPEGMAYKVGRTQNLNMRLNGFSFPCEVKVIHTIEADRAGLAETFFHRHFHAQRLRNEWFALTREQVDWFQSFSGWVAADHSLPDDPAVPERLAKRQAAGAERKRKRIEAALLVRPKQDRRVKPVCLECSERQAEVRHWCRRCYQRLRYQGRLPRRPATPCCVPGCPEPHQAHGYCRSHYDRVRHHGTPEPGRAIPLPACRLCGGAPVAARGLCWKHYQRERRG